MSDFGDWTDDDAFGTEPADPEQVARKLRRIRQREGLDGEDFDNLTVAEKVVLIAIVAELLDWLRRQGSNF